MVNLDEYHMQPKWDMINTPITNAEHLYVTITFIVHSLCKLYRLTLHAGNILKSKH